MNLNVFLKVFSLGVTVFTLCSCTSNMVKNTPVEASAISGEYRNLFAELGYSQKQVSEKIKGAFDHLFYGDSEDAKVFYPAGENADGPMAYIYDVNSDDVRSEGMSYGMMIAVQMDKKSEFDAIWNWSNNHMYHKDPAHPAKGFFAWSVKTNGEIIDEMPAPDGEEYFATALYFASKRWGDGAGIYNYSAQADKLLHDILHREIITGKTKRGVMTAGSLFSKEHTMVRFTPDAINAEHTDASYHLPAFYEIWARIGPLEDRDFWKKTAHVSRDYFHQATHPETALSPDYGEFDGSPWSAPWRPESEDFRYDAWRTAMNWSMDWAWWAVDPGQQDLSDRLQAFFESEGMDTYGNLYTLDGKMLGEGQTAALVSMNATASMAATHPRSRKFVQALWDLEAPTGRYRYYDGMLYMMALLHCGGEFKAWY